MHLLGGFIIISVLHTLLSALYTLHLNKVQFASIVFYYLKSNYWAIIVGILICVASVKVLACWNKVGSCLIRIVALYARIYGNINHLHPSYLLSIRLGLLCHTALVEFSQAVECCLFHHNSRDPILKTKHQQSMYCQPRMTDHTTPSTVTLIYIDTRSTSPCTNLHVSCPKNPKFKNFVLFWLRLVQPNSKLLRKCSKH